MSEIDQGSVTPTTGIAERAEGDAEVGVFKRLRKLRLERFAVLLVFCIVFAVFSFMLPNIFPTVAVLSALGSAQAVPMILAIGLLFPLRGGDFDLSIGATMVVSAMIVATLTVQHGLPWIPAALICLGIGVIIGMINGFLVVVIGLDGFITTLATMTAITGVGYGVSGGLVLSGMPNSLTNFARVTWLGVPVPVFYGLGLALIVWYVLQLTPYGRNLLFIGGNRNASSLAGLKVKQNRFAAYVICATFAAFAGIVLAGIIGSADPTIGGEYLLPPYAAAFLGTTAFSLGRFNLPGTVLGLYLLAVVVTGLELLGAPFWISDVFYGAALVLAVSFAQLVKVLGARRS